MLGAAGVGTATVYHAASQPQDDAMKAPSHLDDDQIERLSQLLDQRAVPFKGVGRLPFGIGGVAH